MDAIDLTLDFDQRAAILLRRVAACVPAMQREASGLDRDAVFPTADIEALRALGLFAAVAPRNRGGLGLGTEAVAATAMATLLRLLGRGNLAVGRIVEGHVNALRLVCRYGTDAQIDTAARWTRDGHLFGLWVTEASDGVRLDNGVLQGAKSFCSAADAATRALITARDAAGAVRLVMIALDPGRRAGPMAQPPQGMRATGTGRVRLDGMRVEPDSIVGAAGDYLREPEFSAGAWRSSAVTLGGLDALVDAACRQLAERGRDADPMQRARMGQAIMARETASLWVDHAAAAAHDAAISDAARQATINLARLAVEAATLDAIRLVQRSIGLACFMPPNPIERIARDLNTYLRQPAPDEALADAALHCMTQGMPDLVGT